MPIPADTLVCDAVIHTIWGYRRNRFYYTCSAAPADLPTLAALADGVFGKLQPLFTPLMANRATFQRIEARYYGSGGTQTEANSTVASVDGGIAVPGPGTELDDGSLPDMLPDEVSLIVQVRTGLVGRSKRGRRFLTGLAERIQYAGIVDQAYRATAKTLADGLSDVIHAPVPAAPDTDLSPVHYDRKNNMMVGISKCYAILTMGTRKDRRRPLELERI